MLPEGRLRPRLPYHEGVGTASDLSPGPAGLPERQSCRHFQKLKVCLCFCPDKRLVASPYIHMACGQLRGPTFTPRHFNQNSWLRLRTQSTVPHMGLEHDEFCMENFPETELLITVLSTREHQHGTGRLCDSGRSHAHVGTTKLCLALLSPPRAENTYSTPSFCSIMIDSRPLFLIITHIYDSLLLTLSWE